MGKKLSFAVEQVHSSALELKAERGGTHLGYIINKECRQRAGKFCWLKIMPNTSQGLTTWQILSKHFERGDEVI